MSSGIKGLLAGIALFVVFVGSAVVLWPEAGAGVMLGPVCVVVGIYWWVDHRRVP
jgi:hypothetical protein